MALLSITAKTADSPSEIKTQALVVLMPERKTLSPYLKALDTLLGGTVSRSIKQGDFSGSGGSHMWLPGAGGIQRVLLVGCGDPAKQTIALAKKVGESIARTIVKQSGCRCDDCDGRLDHEAEHAGATDGANESSANLAHYQYSETLNKRRKPPRTLKRVAIAAGTLCTPADARRAIRAGTATGQGANLTRELVNLPGNLCTPKYLASEARRLARSDKKLSVSVLDERKMAELGMHSLLSVGNGSEQPSQLIVIKYQGAAAKARPYCLVGKGITFDTGGISLKARGKNG